MSKTRKIISIMLTVLTLLSVVSVANPVFAAEVTEIAETESNSEITDSATEENETEVESENEESEILYEDIDNRDKYTKHFVLRNGLKRAIKYSQPVHYKEKDEWVEIDNTLNYDENSEKYENNSNSFKVKFDEKLNSEEFFTIENKGYTMSWQYNGNNIRQALTEAKVENFSEKNNDKKHKENRRIPKTNAKIKYDSFEAKCNLEYVVTSTGVKENIILESYSGKNKFSFEVTAKDLELIKNEDKSITVVNQNKEEIFYIPAPFMYDADNQYCYDVDYSIKNKNGKYIISVIADEKWLQDEERKYPVTIDPIIETEKNTSAIETTFVASGTATTNYNGVGDIYIGIESTNYKKCRTLVKFELPALKSSDMVVRANLGMFMYDTSFYTTTMPDKQINAHTITSSWNIGNVTWNTQPSFNDKVADYNFIKHSDTSGTNYGKAFDITRTVKEWYEDVTENNGILIKSAVEDGSNSDIAARAIFRSDNYTDERLMPYIEIEYRNNKGLESYWDYSSFGAGAAGTAHINDYTGNLVYELPILSSISEIMPVSITGYYNNYCANKLICETEGEYVRTSIGRGFRLNYQQTVILSSKYGLSGNSAETYPYVYTDSDGTEHYIKKVVENEGKDDEKTTYQDEDGLGIELTKDLAENEEGTYKITDKANYRYYFNRKGNLFRIIDNSGNETNIIYKEASEADDLPEKSRIDKIIDGAGHTYQFYYSVKDSTGIELDYVDKIIDDANRVYNFSIVNGRLRKFTHPDGSLVKIIYQTFENSKNEEDLRINKIISNDIYEINVDYTSEKNGRRIRKVKEYGTKLNSDEETYTYYKGQTVSFDRSKYNTTIMRSCGMDGIHYSDDSSKGKDDIITTVQYDDMGRAISQQTKFGSGEEIGAGSCAYTTNAEDDSASGFKNKVSGSGSVGKHVDNVILGGNGENLDNWSFIQKGSVDAESGTSSASEYIGNKSLKLTVNDVVNTNDRCYFRQKVTNFEPGKTYTFSAYVKTGDLVPIYNSASTGAYIEVIAYNSDGDAIEGAESRSQRLTKRTNLDVNKGWRRLSATIEIPENASYLRCFLSMRNTEGSVCFDGIQLEKGESANDYNMLENSGFEIQSGNEATGWSGTNDFVFETGKNGVIKPSELPNTDYYSDITTNTFKITGECDVEKGVYQTVAVEGNPDDTYILSGWAKGFPVNSTYHTSGSGKNIKEIATFEIAVKVNYSASDGTSPEQFKTPASFNTTITDWQCATVPISLKYTGGEKDVTYTPTSIKIIPRYHNQENFVFFDKIMLVKDTTSSYTYDKDGNLLSAASNSEQKANMKYDDNNNLTSYTDTAGYKTTAEYYGNNNLKLTKSAKDVYTKYNIDEQGNVIYTELRNSSEHDKATMAIRTNNYYYEGKTDDGVTINDGAYKTGYRDENANLTSYTPDHKTGTVTKITNADGVETNYEYYGTFGKKESVSTGNSKVTYNYNNNEQLTNILFGSDKKENYYFEYNNYGQIYKTKVGSQTLCTNTYMNNNGPLETITYENGDKRRFTYNNLGQKRRIYSTNDNGSEKLLYSWAYNSAGTQTAYVDRENDISVYYDYDSLGRISKAETLHRTEGTFLGSAEYAYDIRDNLTNLITTYGGNSVEQRYSYSENALSSKSATYAKDNLPTVYQLYDDRYAVYEYDSINRLNQRMFNLKNTPLYYNYIYKSSDRNGSGESLYRTHQISKEFIGNGVYVYGYDVLGNITSIKKAVRKSTVPTEADFKEYIEKTDYVTYTYDKLGQLTRENNITSNKTTVWDYDELGNITSKSEYAYTTEDLEDKTATKTITYGYGKDSKSGWNNLLVSVDENGNKTVDTGETIAYDKIGNPTTYLGATLAWNGRQLTNYTKGDTTVSYKYDADGLRTSKTVNGVTSKYFYVNGQLHYEERTDGTKLYFFYDSNGYLSAIEYNGTNYYPATNKRGDIVAIYRYTGDLYAKYEYDAWGNVISVKNANDVEITSQTHIANVNPIRYRGYYFDSETGLYYLQSRYYNAEVGRFLNSDSISDSGAGVLGYNTFIYCANNPVNALDPSGHFILSAILLGAVVGAAVSAASDIGCQLIGNGFNTKEIDWRSVGRSAVIGGVCGAISGGIGGAVSSYGVSQVAQVATDIVLGGCSNVAETVWRNEGNVSFSECAKSFVVGSATSAIGVGAAQAVQKINGKVFQSFSNKTQKQLLNSNSYGKTYTTAMVDEGAFLKDSAYFECVSGGTTLTSNAWSSATLLFIDFFSEENSK